jgi:1,6-anhydro-N-acetylmuramate kinase
MPSVEKSGKVLVVGINPSDWVLKPNCTTHRRLPKWLEYMGISQHTFVNCIGVPGKYRMNDVRYELIKDHVDQHDKVIALGNFPSAVLSKLSVDHFTLPHPSGLNRKLNDKDYELMMLDRCRDYIMEV